MDEKDVQKFAPKVFLAGLVVWIIVGVVLKSVAFPLGWLLGYGVSVLSFKMIIKFTDLVLDTKQAIIPIILMFLSHTVLYILGFLIAIFFKEWFNLISVFFGYFITNISIQILGRKNRGGEMSV